MQVPSLWECSMNKDVLLNSCDKGSSEEWVEASANMVNSSNNLTKRGNPVGGTSAHPRSDIGGITVSCFFVI